MRLERLEISGFKSFSDRSELAFDEGVTAIVGPNGCGKSNVADAITWVLGEQSAKSLRGEKMEDVIFSGSDARKPGATAEVRLASVWIGGPAVQRRHSRLGRTRADRVPRGRSGRQRSLGRPLQRQRQRPWQRQWASARRSRVARGDCARLHARRRGHAAAVPVRRERIPDRRRGLPPARRPRADDGHRAWAPRPTRSSSRARSG